MHGAKKEQLTDKKGKKRGLKQRNIRILELGYVYLFRFNVTPLTLSPMQRYTHQSCTMATTPPPW
jgi:hypothetical protein